MDEEQLKQRPDPARQILEMLEKQKAENAKNLNNLRFPASYVQYCRQWSHYEKWTLNEAANLLVGCIPKRPWGLPGHHALDSIVAKMREKILRSTLITVGTFPKKYLSKDIMQWTRSLGIDVPPELAGLFFPEIIAKPAQVVTQQKEKKKRRNQIAKVCCQKEAIIMWGKDPELTIKAIIDSPAILETCGGKHYTKPILHKWVSKTANRPKESRRRGRRAGSTKIEQK